jgi:hypothetical protein
MSGLAGTIEAVVLDGTNFLVTADINVTQNQGTENVFLPTSGEAMPQAIKKNASAEGVTISADGPDYVILQGLHDRTANGETYSIAYVTAGSKETYTATGGINFESRETESNKASIMLLPLGDWVPFI